MIEYDAGIWGFTFILRVNGSVFPKALAIAVPHTIITVLLHVFLVKEFDGNPLNGLDVIWAGFTSVLSFLLVFRNNQAYTRFWEGATLIYQVRGEWFNAVSALFAFCNRSPEAEPQVRQFQHNLVRLASLLYCSALQQVCDLGDDCLEVLEVLEFEGMDKGALAFLKASNDRCEVILQWMQRLIVEANDTCTVTIAPPLLTRAFQELSRGIVNLNNARKIQDIPFPFPYAQLIMCMLIAHWLATPFIIAMYVESVAVAASGSFLVTFFVWCLVYINMELDQPFGEDANDLSLNTLQSEFNQSLVTLMHPLAQQVPVYDDDKGKGNTHASPSFLARSSLTRTFQTAAVEAGMHKAELFMDVVARIYNAYLYSRNSASRLPERLKMGMLMNGDWGAVPRGAADHEQVAQPMCMMSTGGPMRMMNTGACLQGDQMRMMNTGACLQGDQMRMMSTGACLQGDQMRMMNTGACLQGDQDLDWQMGATSSALQVGGCPTCSHRRSLQATGDRSPLSSSSTPLVARATTPTALAPLAGDSGEADGAPPAAAAASAMGEMGRWQPFTPSAWRSTEPCFGRHVSAARGASVGLGRSQPLAPFGHRRPAPWPSERGGEAGRPSAGARNDCQGCPGDAERPEPGMMAEELQVAPHEDDQHGWDPTRRGRMHI